MTKTSLTDALGISRQTLYDILNEKQPVTAGMAVRFGKLLGNGTFFRVNLQRTCDLATAESTVDISGMPTMPAQTLPDDPSYGSGPTTSRTRCSRSACSSTA